MQQLDHVTQVTGRPTADDISCIKSRYAPTLLRALPPRKQKTLQEVFPTASQDALDLISKCMHFNPSKRITGM